MSARIELSTSSVDSGFFNAPHPRVSVCRVGNPTVVFGDNDAANELVKEYFISTGNRGGIDVLKVAGRSAPRGGAHYSILIFYCVYHWIKEVDAYGHVDVKPKRTKLNSADLFAKPAGSGVVERLVAKVCGYKDFRNEDEIA